MSVRLFRDRARQVIGHEQEMAKWCHPTLEMI